MAKIVTTREIFVHLSRGARKLERTTTKHVDASIKVVQPKNPQKPVTLSTTGLPDVQDIIDKKKRDDVMAQRKIALKDQKKIAKEEKKKAKIVEKAFEKGDTIYQDAKGDVVVIPKKRATVEDATEEEKEVKLVEPSKELTAELATEKKKLEMTERMKKVRAGKDKKKEEKK